MRLARGCVGIALALIACGRGEGRAGGVSDSAAQATLAVPAVPGATLPAACPKTGRWTACLVRERLERSGLAPQRDTMNSELPALSVAPERYRVGDAALAVYVFPDTLARRRGASMLDTTRFIAPSRALGIQGEATAIQSDNLLALLFSRNEHRRERVADALTAGPPQP